MKSPGGGLGIFTDRDQRSIFGVLNFENLYFFGYCSQLLYFWGLLNNCCIFKCFIFLTVFFWVQFYAPGTSVITVLHYYHHIVLNFYQMNSVFGGYFFRVLLFGKYFFGCSVSGKVFFWVVQKYPTPLIPVCRFIKSTLG